MVRQSSYLHRLLIVINITNKCHFFRTLKWHCRVIAFCEGSYSLDFIKTENWTTNEFLEHTRDLLFKLLLTKTMSESKWIFHGVKFKWCLRDLEGDINHHPTAYFKLYCWVTYCEDASLPALFTLTKPFKKTFVHPLLWVRPGSFFFFFSEIFCWVQADVIPAATFFFNIFSNNQHW